MGFARDLGVVSADDLPGILKVRTDPPNPPLDPDENTLLPSIVAGARALMNAMGGACHVHVSAHIRNGPDPNDVKESAPYVPAGPGERYVPMRQRSITLTVTQREPMFGEQASQAQTDAITAAVAKAMALHQQLSDGSGDDAAVGEPLKVG